MGAFKDFDAARAEVVGESIGFKFGGEDFSVPLPLSSMAMMDLTRAARCKTDVEAFGVLDDFFLSTFGEENKERFLSAARRIRAGTEELQSIIFWILEEATGKEQARSSTSPDTLPTTTESSPVAAETAA